MGFTIYRRVNYSSDAGEFAPPSSDARFVAVVPRGGADIVILWAVPEPELGEMIERFPDEPTAYTDLLKRLDLKAAEADPKLIRLEKLGVVTRTSQEEYALSKGWTRK